MPSSRSDIAEPPEADVAVAANLDTFLDKEWEDKPIAEVLKAPVSALQGVSEGDADMLQQAFNIETVGGLGKNKYFRAAQLLTPLAEAGARKARRSRPAGSPPGSRRCASSPEAACPRPSGRITRNELRGVVRPWGSPAPEAMPVGP
jgi:hypothetical protein